MSALRLMVEFQSCSRWFEMFFSRLILGPRCFGITKKHGGIFHQTFEDVGFEIPPVSRKICNAIYLWCLESYIILCVIFSHAPSFDMLAESSHLFRLQFWVNSFN